MAEIRITVKVSPGSRIYSEAIINRVLKYIAKKDHVEIKEDVSSRINSGTERTVDFLVIGTVKDIYIFFEDVREWLRRRRIKTKRILQIVMASLRDPDFSCI